VRKGPASLLLTIRKHVMSVMFRWFIAQKKITIIVATITFHNAMGSSAGGMVNAHLASTGPNFG
jgi:hypothetical protein